MTKYKVKVAPRGRRVVVNADYFRVENGVITFRNEAIPGFHGGYPVFVRCFAPGAWFDVENSSVESDTVR